MKISSKKKLRNTLSKNQKKPLKVMVCATMSAGKSTFINSIIGSELLHCANEATTASIAIIEKIHQNTEKSAACYDSNQNTISKSKNVCAHEIKRWNSNESVRHIRIQTPFTGTHLFTNGLVLHDTPGPNNSQNINHSNLTFEALRSINPHTLCYVLNASQLGITDDQKLLSQLQEELKQRKNIKVIFALNKVDLLDPERGESLEISLAHSQEYLENNGFKQPVIIPTMSQTALLVKKHLRDDTLTLKERSQLRRSIETVPTSSPCLPPAIGISENITRKCLDALRRMKYSIRLQQKITNRSDEVDSLVYLLAQSGIPTFETVWHHQQ